MNLLGHLYFSYDDLELMYANLYGDFVKGSDWKKYPNIVQKGILLHREIDHYIDHHPDVKKLAHQLHNDLPKVSGIAIDLFFDHCLAKNWCHFHHEELYVYLNRFYNFTPENWKNFSPSFQKFILALKKHHWISYYSSIDGLEKACRGVASRISFENQLSNAAQTFIDLQDDVEQCFNHFMKDASVHFNALKFN